MSDSYDWAITDKAIWASIQNAESRKDATSFVRAAAKEVESEVVVVGKMSVDAFAKMQRAIAACEEQGE